MWGASRFLRSRSAQATQTKTIALDADIMSRRTLYGWTDPWMIRERAVERCNRNGTAMHRVDCPLHGAFFTTPPEFAVYFRFSAFYPPSRYPKYCFGLDGVQKRK